jgi:hypothetical protein
MKPLVQYAAIGLILIPAAIVPVGSAHAQESRTTSSSSLEALKQEAVLGVERQRALIQQIIDQLFS